MEQTPTPSLEEIANYQGNDSLLLFERVSNPVIRDQIIDLLCESEQSRDGSDIETIELDESGTTKKGEDGGVIFKTIQYKALSRDEIASNFDEWMRDEKSVTWIHFDDDPNTQSSSSRMEMNALAPWNDKPYDEKQMSIIEAHEKGHNIRPYRDDFFKKHFKGAFSPGPEIVTDTDVEMYRKVCSEEEKDLPTDQIRGLFLEYLFHPMEIAERMSQIKNYFGMSGNDVFTRDHLRYAAEHYAKDTGLDNGMGMFFRAIQPENEGEFVRLINCSGI
jgi:hypothetical protein